MPTAIESGYDIDAYTCNAFFLPKGTPDNIVNKLNQATTEALAAPNISEMLEAAGLVTALGKQAAPACLGQFLKSEIAKWEMPIKVSGAIIE